MTTAVFETRPGRVDDSPAQACAALAARRPDVRRTWVGDESGSLAGTHDVVRRGSGRHLASLATADLVVTSDLVSRRWLPRPRTTCVQTWHGTPLKLLGFDERSRAYDAAGTQRAALRRDVRRWDLLVSAGPAATALLRSAFRYDGPVLEVGSPRNDALLDARAPALREQVRGELGAHDRRLVLHAPTWRDDGRVLWAHREFQALLDALPEEVLLCVRRHPRDPAPPPHPRLVDVGDRGLTGLLAAADVLVSDYSAVVADFALTRRPIVLFAPDLAEYTALRGLYDDVETWSAWPVTRTAAELVEAVKRPEVDAAAHQRFVDTWCPYDDGHAGERVAEALSELLTSSS